MAQTMLAELVRRRVFTPSDDIGRMAAGPLQVITGGEAISAEASLAL